MDLTRGFFSSKESSLTLCIIGYNHAYRFHNNVYLLIKTIFLFYIDDNYYFRLFILSLIAGIQAGLLFHWE